MTGAPEISVVVPSHDRPLRLLWLLNALEEQTLDRSRWEVVVAHDSRGPETEDLLRSHPLAAAGVLRHLTFDPGPGPAAKRNAGWRAARAPLIAFTDDDCRPPAEWLERTLEAARRHPGAIVQGATRPEPDEAELLAVAPHARTIDVTPPSPWAHTCNILYPREWLERVDGFDETLPAAAGEDTDLALRARAAGAEYVGAPEVLTHHAVNDFTFIQLLRWLPRWQHGAYVVKRHPQVREHLPLGLFWKPSHVRLPFLLLGLLLARRHPLFALLALPWMKERLPYRGSSPRARLRALRELPGRAVIDVVEMAVCARGAVRYRTPFL
jgi:GT2 family glycosyltransferase